MIINKTYKKGRHLLKDKSLLSPPKHPFILTLTIMETSQVHIMAAMQLCIKEIEKIQNVNYPMREAYDKVWETYLEETKDETIFNLSDEQWKDKFGELPKEYYTREDTKNKLFKEYANLHYKLLGVKIELSPITIYYETKDAFKNKKLITA